MNTGINILQNETVVCQISPFGIWLSVNQKEYFIDFEDYPQFVNATIAQITNFKTDLSNNLHWPGLDIDIELESLENPRNYPLVYR